MRIGTRSWMVAVMAAASFAAVATGAAAQTAGDATVLVVPKTVVNGMPDGHSGGTIEILADGWLCGEVRFDERAAPPDESGDQVFALDRASQYAVCSETGAELTFVTGEGRVLAERLTVQSGERMTLSSLAPEAPVAGGPTWLAIPQTLVGDTSLTYLDVFADDERCGRLSLTEVGPLDAFGDVMLPLSGGAVPAVCSVAGTRLDVVDSAGHTLFRHPLVVPGARVMVVGIGPDAPHTGEETPTPASTASAATVTAPMPPNAGSGMADSGAGRPAAMATLVALGVGTALLVLASRKFGTGRSRG